MKSQKALLRTSLKLLGYFEEEEKIMQLYSKLLSCNESCTFVKVFFKNLSTYFSISEDFLRHRRNECIVYLME